MFTPKVRRQIPDSKFAVANRSTSRYLQALTMTIIKPNALKRGDVIGIAAPASPPQTEEHLARGIRYLESNGFRVELGKHVYGKTGYLAGSDRERTFDLHDLFSNKQVKAIFTVRGGYGCTRILPLLNYRLIRQNPKILVGYSDITALQLAMLTKAGLVSFSGPMVAVEMAGTFTGEAEESFWRCMTSKAKRQSIGIEKNSRVVVRSGKAEGTLWGGNLSLIASLVGTNYVPRLKNSILLLEEIGERPYRVNRMLNQLKLAGLFRRAAGVAFGLFTDCEPERGKPSLTIRQVFEDTFQEFKFPAGGHFHYGHVDDSLTIPFGVTVRFDADRGRIVFLENALQ